MVNLDFYLQEKPPSFPESRPGKGPNVYAPVYRSEWMIVQISPSLITSFKTKGYVITFSKTLEKLLLSETA